MKKVLITFSGGQYDATTAQLVEQGPKLGADEVWVYDDVWLTQQAFYKQNKWLWDHPHKRGFGWYAWKPFIIFDALMRLGANDAVLFVDADCRPISDFSVLFQQCALDGGIMVFAAETYSHHNWCKRDCFIVMGQDERSYRMKPHAVARFMVFQRGPWLAWQFLMEWLTYCVNPLANTFDGSVLAPEYKELTEHRAEQAILTNLAHKYGLKLYREADAGGEVEGVWERERAMYPQLFAQENPNHTPESSNKTLPVLGSKYRNV